MKTLLTITAFLLFISDSSAIDSRFLLKPEDLPASKEAVNDSRSSKITSGMKTDKKKKTISKIADSTGKKTNASPPPKSKSALLITRSDSNRKSKISRNAAPISERHELRLNHAQSPKVADNVTPLLKVWHKISGKALSTSHSVDISKDKYSLSFDTTKYPVLSTSDGRKIMLDTAGTLPPLVQSLALSSDPMLKIVSEDPSNRKRFLSSLLNSAGFYSVEENFVLKNGTDPLIRIFADFKVEKKSDSLLKQDILLVNHNEKKGGYPATLIETLAGQGFTVVEPYTEYAPEVGKNVDRGEIISIRNINRESAADAILKTAGVDFVKGKELSLYSFASDGVDLKVRADRSFSIKSIPFVVSFFDGDPVNYTLVRLLETRGYKVVHVDAKDALPQISKKLMNTLRLDGIYGFSEINLPKEYPYTFSITGLHTSSTENGRKLIVTDRKLTPFFKSLAEESGFKVTEQD